MFSQFPKGPIKVERDCRVDPDGNVIINNDIGWQLRKDNKCKPKGGDAVTHYYSCMGAVRCTNPECDLMKGNIDIKPRSKNKLVAKQVCLCLKYLLRSMYLLQPCLFVLYRQIESPCTRCKQKTLIHHECNVKVTFYYVGSKCTLNQRGEHNHGVYDAKHPTEEGAQRFKQLVLERPTESPKGLQIDQSAQHPVKQTPVGTIENFFQHRGRVKYLRKAVISMHELQQPQKSGESTAISDFNGIHDRYPGYLRQPMDIHPNSFCIPICTPGIQQYVDFKTNPVITDVTYNCFEKWLLLMHDDNVF